ncbi:DsbE family thiol:disulfide interchange protein [Marinobacter salicampi]|uniref:DsbE family thiol:disulfide interchange protein n=1 Tax=Marinobacter salicampi TaxID=435907 RepID=UPI00140955FA|nr:DsbE family thiol:disulfide interchange protein [Marinobacter salicampi]
MRRVLLFIPVVLAIILGLVLAAGIGKDTTTLESALIGKPMPEFQLADLRTPDTQLTNEVFKGQVSLLNVWGTWCPACRDEHPDLLWLARDKGVPIVGLNYKDNRSQAIEWLDTLGDPYSTNLYDPQGKLGFDLGVYGAPETFVVDRQGVIRYRHVGVVDEKVWEEVLGPLVRKYREES